MRVLLALVLLLVLAADAGAATRGLRSFESCAQLVRYARAAERVPVRAFAPPPVVVGREDVQADAGRAETQSAADASGTNVQEAGIDEPDVLKADARRALALADGTLRWVDLTGAEPRLAGSLPLRGHLHQMLVRGDTAIVLAQDGARVVVTEVDVRDPAAMAVRRTLEVPGALATARLTGATARVVVTAFASPGPARQETLRRFVPRSVLRSRVSGRTFRRGVVACDDVQRPPEPGGAALLSVLTFDVDRGLHSIDRAGVLASAQAVYASHRSLVVATTTPDGGQTALHRFDASRDDATPYRSSGVVDGEVLNQFSLSEHEGVLRVATTRGLEESFVTTLREDGAALVRAGRVGGLGRGERIYAVRFLGDTGYVVTFRQVDPLYVVDLSDPARPRVRGELKVRGYSAYLHPAGDGLLIGVGVDATADGRRLGAQVSLFDVSDPARPRRLHARALGAGSSTAVELDHHAFLWWAPSRLAVLPVEGADEEGTAVAKGLRIAPDSGIDPVATIEHRGPDGRVGIERSAVAGERLLTLSALGVAAHRLDGLSPAGFAAFPAPPTDRLSGRAPR